MWSLSSMRHIPVVAISLLLSGITSAQALDQRIEKSLLKLDPTSRLEQSCDAELMERIAADDTPYKPDRLVAYAMDAPQIAGDTISGNGAAFRSRGKWYRLSFECRTAPDHVRVLSIHYRIGPLIPEEEWERYDLWS